jgi:thioredoxin-like negative regulator of GroEL
MANTYSKSMLRTVAGQLAEELEAVDYFPSYESVMLTRTPAIWTHDLIHIEQEFVRRIMGRVMTTYVDEDAGEPGKPWTEVRDRAARFTSLVRHAQWEQAEPLYEELKSDWTQGAQTDRLHLAAAELLLATGRKDQALKHLAAIETPDPAGLDFLEELRLSTALTQAGRGEAAARLRERLATKLPPFVATKAMINRLVHADRAEEAAYVMAVVEAREDATSDVLFFLVSIYQKLERPDDAHRVSRRLAEMDPDNADLARQLVQSLKSRGEADEGLRLLRRLEALEDVDLAWLGRSYSGFNAFPDAERVFRRLWQEDGRSESLQQLCVTLLKLRRPDEVVDLLRSRRKDDDELAKLYDKAAKRAAAKQQVSKSEQLETLP